jgi:hypothetical protein
VHGRAICYTNETARCVNDYRENRRAAVWEASGQRVVRAEGRVYYEGQVLRCRKFNKTPRLYVNFTYNVRGFEEKDGVVTGIFLAEVPDFPFALNLVKRLFIYDHANTCHSQQGMSADDGVTLFDVDIWCASREWLYTGLTRTRDLQKVFFWDPAAGEVGGLPVVMRSDFQQGMEAKLRGYKEQDTTAGRLWDAADYIDGHHIMALLEEQDGRCAHCQAWLPPRWEAKDRSQPTLDRVDNDLAHIVGNCVLSCLRCNNTRH